MRVLKLKQIDGTEFSINVPQDVSYFNLINFLDPCQGPKGYYQRKV